MRWIRPEGAQPCSYKYQCSSCGSVCHQIKGNHRLSEKIKQKLPDCTYKFCPNCGEKVEEIKEVKIVVLTEEEHRYIGDMLGFMCQPEVRTDKKAWLNLRTISDVGLSDIELELKSAIDMLRTGHCVHGVTIANCCRETSCTDCTKGLDTD